MKNSVLYMGIVMAIMIALFDSVRAAPLATRAVSEAPDGRNWTVVPKFTLNLDLPAKERWAPIVSRYKDQVPALLAYLESNIPKWAMPIIQEIGKGVRPYFGDYGEEMEGIADTYGLKAPLHTSTPYFTYVLLAKVCPLR